MIDVDCMIRSLRLGWLQRVFNDSSATWKRYFLYLLEHVGGIFFLSCNFDVKDFNLPSPFYYELLQWQSEFRDTFAEKKHYKNIIWNNKEIKIDNKPVYLKNYREAGITYTHRGGSRGRVQGVRTPPPEMNLSSYSLLKFVYLTGQ